MLGCHITEIHLSDVWTVVDQYPNKYLARSDLVYLLMPTQFPPMLGASGEFLSCILFLFRPLLASDYIQDRGLIGRSRDCFWVQQLLADMSGPYKSYIYYCWLATKRMLCVGFIHLVVVCSFVNLSRCRLDGAQLVMLSIYLQLRKELLQTRATYPYGKEP